MDYNTLYEIPTTVSVNDQLSQLSTTSSKIRFLLENGYTRSQIAKVLNIRYQHVRNVQITPIKKQR